MSKPKIFDILVIGGGITGAAAVRDAAMRGFSACLVEKGDFCSGTSSRSTKMLHGGLRYLEQYDFRLVREALKERELLIGLAPHQIKAVRFLLPIYKGDRFGPFKINLGMKLYGWLCPRKGMEPYKVLNPEMVLKKEPHLRKEGLLGAGWYDEYLLISPERFVLSMIQSARRYGAETRNYLQVVNLLQDGDRVKGVEVEDKLTGKMVTIFARIIVNTTGPWVDNILRMANPNPPRRVRATKGIHFLVPKISDHAVIFAARRDGRLIFGIPWLNYTIIGSTDTDYNNDLDEVHADKDEVDYLLAELKQVLDHPAIDRSQIIFTYAGIRPLAYEGGKSESEVSRKHIIFEGKKEGGIISVTGGKLTIARLMGEQIVDIASKRLGKKTSCGTAKEPLPGGNIPKKVTVEEFISQSVREITQKYGISEETGRLLLSFYGTEFRTLLKLAEEIPNGKTVLCSHAPNIGAQVHYAVKHEMAKTIQDVLFRRTNIGMGPPLHIEECERIADIMAAHLGWDKVRKTKEIASYFADRKKREQY